MRLQYISLGFALLCLSSMGVASEKSAVHKAQTLEKLSTDFYKSIYFSPAARYYSPIPNYKELKLSYQWGDNTNLHLLQNGEGYSNIRIDVEGMQRSGKLLFWGAANYDNQTTFHVKWTDVSDPWRVGPYTVADTLGGDYHGEKYGIHGGVSFLTQHHWNIGLEAAFEGRNNYRKKDPRPENSCSDLWAKIGVSKKVTQNYLLSATGGAGQYKQKVAIDVYGEAIDYYFYTLNGFGQYNKIFTQRGTSFSRDYLGNNYQAALSLVPYIEQKHWIADFTFHGENIEIKEDNRFGHSVFSYRWEKKNYQGTLGYNLPTQVGMFYIKANVDYHQGRGTERIFEAVKINEQSTAYEYRKLSESQKFNRDLFQIHADVIWSVEHPKCTFQTKAKVGYQYLKQEYLLPSYYFQFNYVTSKLQLQTLHRLKKGFVSCVGSIGYKAQTQHQSHLPNVAVLADQLPEVVNTYSKGFLPNIEYLDNNFYDVNLSLGYHHMVKEKMDVYIKGNVASRMAFPDKTISAGATLGTRF